MEAKILVTGGGGVTGRAVARSLRISQHFKNAKLISSDIYQNEFGIFEGLFDNCYKLPHSDHPDYAIAFDKLIQKEKPDAVLLMTEKEALFWGTSSPQFPCLVSPFEFSTIAGHKARLYEALKPAGLVPEFLLFNLNDQSFQQIFSEIFNNKPVWVRCYEEGTSSGKGAYLVRSVADAEAWFAINPTINSYLISTVLVGGNYACNLLFKEGKLLQHAIYERLEYFMPHLSPSGITGNIAVGKLINNNIILENSIHAIRIIEQYSNSIANGIYTVDLKGDQDNFPMVTEINLRHTAATGSFAQGGCNMAEFQVLATIGLDHKIPNEEILFHPNNRLLRDIDGLPVFIQDYEQTLKDVLMEFK
jgi:hypothetical protein